MKIIGLSSAGEDSLPLFMDMTQAKTLAEMMKEKYDMHKGVFGLDIMRINDDTIRFVT
jgi:hypothetical protein